MSVKDVAKIMGVSAKTVYTRLERGRQILISKLKGELYD
jgi:DNA-directed RNA polymerase specialized sigma24 family protein